MANMSIVLCVGCGFDLTEHPKIRRILGSSYKRDNNEVRSWILKVWKDFVSDRGYRIVATEDELRMCRSCFNKFNKLAICLLNIYEKFSVALPRSLEMNIICSTNRTEDTQASQNCTESLTPSRKKASDEADSAPSQKRMSNQPQLLTSGASSPATVVWVTFLS